MGKIANYKSVQRLGRAIAVEYWLSGRIDQGVYLLKASQSQPRLMPVFIGVSGFDIFTFNRWDH